MEPPIGDTAGRRADPRSRRLAARAGGAPVGERLGRRRQSRSRSPTCSARSPRGSRRSSRSSAARWPARSPRASTASARGCSAGRWRRNGGGAALGARAAPRARAAAARARRPRHLDDRPALRRGDRDRAQRPATSQHEGVLYLEKRRLHTTSADDRVEPSSAGSGCRRSCGSRSAAWSARRS